MYDFVYDPPIKVFSGHTLFFISIAGSNPHWNTSMQFLIKDVNQDILCLTVFDRDYFSPDEFLGRTEIRIMDVVGGCEERRGPVQRTLKLLETSSGVITIKLDVQLY